ncbi:MAG TPA: DUF1206 domain-containing protein [Chloroflexota bacterium]|nr:DUF1206 domain-containing protein [Chloroflexota bacterium]
MAGSIASGKRVAHVAERKARGPGLEGLARAGYVAKGLVYLIIGVLAAKVAIGDGGKITDNSGALRAIYQEPFGRLLLSVVVIGLLGYAIWCFCRSFLDLDHVGSKAKGLAARIGFVVIGILYLVLAYGGLRLVMGTGSGKSSDASTKDWTATLLNQSNGKAIVSVVGIVVLAIALYLFYYAYSCQFMRMFGAVDSKVRSGIQRLGQIGYVAQGVVFAEIGIFLLVAAQRHNARDAQGIGGALQQLTHQPYGHFLLAIVAAGFIAYGIYGFAQARYRRIPTS